MMMVTLSWAWPFVSGTSSLGHIIQSPVVQCPFLSRASGESCLVLRRDRPGLRNPSLPDHLWQIV
jgi:hypothetical protein